MWHYLDVCCNKPCNIRPFENVHKRNLEADKVEQSAENASVRATKRLVVTDIAKLCQCTDITCALEIVSENQQQLHFVATNVAIFVVR